MVDFIVSKMMEWLTSAVIDKAEEEVKLVLDTKEDVEKLKSNHLAIKAVLADANQRQLTEPSIRYWIDSLKDVSYDIEDVLDQWSTEIQKAGKEGSGSDADPIKEPEKKKRKKNHFLSLVRLSWSSVTEEAVLNRKFALKIKELNSRLDLIAYQKNTYQLREISSKENPPARPQTISAIDVTEVIGRDQDKQKVMSMLMAESSKTPSLLRVVSIVGVGGLGKSTLAQLVFNDPMVKDHFNYKRIWVHVSNPLDEVKVAKAILQSLPCEKSGCTRCTSASRLCGSWGIRYHKGHPRCTSAPRLYGDREIRWHKGRPQYTSTPWLYGGRGSNGITLEIITQHITKRIKNKCFLLVLDDVWNEDPEKWKPIKTSLLGGSLNSRILVTTRKENVASLMGCTEFDMVRVGGLSPKDSWSLFSQLAFSNWSNNKRQCLEDTGRQLVDKCQGLPLAIRTLGIYLSTCKSRQKWLSVLRSEKWIEVAKTSLLPSLWFSYTDLTSDLKQCFSYCSIFPKGYKIEKYKLIELWMAQGYLSGRKGEDEEMVGENYFEELAACSFFQNFEKDEDDSIVACKMHDMVHDLAKYTASAECHFVEVQSSCDDLIKMDSSSTIQPRHLLIEVRDQTLLAAHFENLKKIRTLFVACRSKLEHTTLDLFSELNCLRSLDLSRCDVERIPSSISSLILLRWLDLSRNRRLKELPEELCELNNLQTLDIRFCQGIQKLPQGIGKLVKLKHLHNRSSCSSFPKGIGRLCNLRTLEEFRVGNDGEAATLGDLKSLKNLQGSLRIRGLGDVADLDEANQVQLRERDLTMLKLDFPGRGDHDHQEVLEALELPSCLRNLGIFHYQGSSVFPNWLLSLTSLRKLTLGECGKCEHLPPLGKLRHLEHLQIAGFYEVEKVGIEFLGVETSYEEDDNTHELEIFPKLAKLQFAWMPKWKAWNDINNRNSVAIMPRLRYLYLETCTKLEALPEYLLQHPTLEKVETWACRPLTEKYPNKEWPKISELYGDEI